MSSSHRLPSIDRIVLACCALFFLSVAGAFAQSATLSNDPILERILAGIRDQAMRQRWIDADRNGKLPALNKIPLPPRPFTKRGANRLQVAASRPRRPIISDRTIIDVQPYSPTARGHYEGAFLIQSQQVGSIVGSIRGSSRGKMGQEQEPFEILYRLPGHKALQTLATDTPYHLIVHDDVEDSAQQRRIILYDRANKRLALAIIAEGSRTPCKVTVESLALTITQQSSGPSPAINIDINGKAVVLKQGQQKDIAIHNEGATVYLVTSYHNMSDSSALIEGQPYYLKIIFFRAAEK